MVCIIDADGSIEFVHGLGRCFQLLGRIGCFAAMAMAIPSQQKQHNDNGEHEQQQQRQQELLPTTKPAAMAT